MAANARRAAGWVSGWHVTPFELSAIDQQLAERFAHGLLNQGLIPRDEHNDGLILAETSLEEIPLLVTSDKHLLGIDEDALSLAFQQAELPFVRVAHPRRMIRALR